VYNGVELESKMSEHVMLWNYLWQKVAGETSSRSWTPPGAQGINRSTMEYPYSVGYDVERHFVCGLAMDSW